MKNKKNSKGFTLIELIAVIVILGVIMTIAIPNIVATLDKNRRDTFIKDAQRAITSAEYTIRSNPKYEWPDSNTIVVFPLNKIKNLDLEVSSFDTYYSLKDSFIAITKEPINDMPEVYDYVYYVHLVSCSDDECKNTEDNSVADNRGINIAKSTSLDESGRYDLVVKGDEVMTDLLRDGNYDKLRMEMNNKYFTTNQKGAVIVY